MKITTALFALVLATVAATFAHTSIKPETTVSAIQAPAVDFQLEPVQIEVDLKSGATVYTIGGQKHFEFEPIQVVGRVALKTTSKTDRCKNPTVEDLYDDAWLNTCIVVAKG